MMGVVLAHHRHSSLFGKADREGQLQRLSATLRQQQEEAARLDAAIDNKLTELGYGG